MRAYRCDQCGMVVDAVGVSDWLELNLADHQVEPSHFCSDSCLALWSVAFAEKGR